MWKGNTPKTLGYVHIPIAHPIKAHSYTIRQTGAAETKDGFKGIVEVAATTAGELDLYRTPGSEKVNNELRIVEIEFLHQIEKEGTKWYNESIFFVILQSITLNS